MKVSIKNKNKLKFIRYLRAQMISQRLLTIAAF